MPVNDYVYVVTGSLFELDTAFSTKEDAERLVDYLRERGLGEYMITKVPFVYYEGEFK